LQCVFFVFSSRCIFSRSRFETNDFWGRFFWSLPPLLLPSSKQKHRNETGTRITPARTHTTRERDRKERDEGAEAKRRPSAHRATPFCTHKSCNPRFALSPCSNNRINATAVTPYPAVQPREKETPQKKETTKTKKHVSKDIVD
jgi:hypothetical protein